MTSVPAVPEFRETDQYWKPLLTHGVDIIRPKPRRLGDMSKTTESCRPSTRDLLMVPLKFHNRDIVGGSAPILNKSSSREVLTPLQSSKGTGLTESSSPSIQICKTPTNGLSFHKTPTRDKMASPCSQRSQQIHNGGNFSQSGRPSSRESIHHAKSSPGLTNSSWDKGEDEGVAADGSLSPYLDSTSNTDCGSLSKSSSDGDPVICRKRPPTRLKSRRRNILSFPQLHLDDAKLLQRRQDCYGGSSSDENRSSGHASMSDGHSSFISSSPTDCVLSRSHAKVHGNRYQHENNENNNDFSENKDFYAADQKILCRGTPLKAVPEDDRLSVATNRHSTSVSTKVIGRRNAGYRKGTHRVREELLPVEGIAGLDDIRYAIEQLSAKNNNCRTNYSTSTYSSMSGSESESVRRLIRHSSLETINTNITNADEFVWIDSHSRLVELQHLPWSNHDVLRVIQTGRLAEHLSRISMETVPRLAYLLQRPLVRISREAQRFSRTLGMCSKQEVSGALKVILSPAMSDSCIKACLRSGAIYAVSGDQLKLSKSARAGLQLSVGRFHRWMCDVRIGTFIHEYAAIYLTAALENLMEEVLLQCLPNDGESMLTASVLESSIANNGDLWGLFQPYSHLNAGRTATGALSLPRWPNLSENSRFGSSSQLHQGEESIRQTSCKSIEQNLLTTCVGSITELGDLLSRVVQYHNRVQLNSSGRHNIAWGPGALHSLYYFMRCSQLEHPDHVCPRAPVQELIYERPYLVLPPLIEWVRVATAHTEYRRSYVVDKDDVMQAARLLLPGVDCPVRQFGICDEYVYIGKQTDESECAHLLKVDLAFRMLTSGRTDLIPHALQILPPSRVNTLNEHGLTPLMLACIRGDEAMVHMLMDAGADVDMETPSCSSLHPFANPETQHWTALTYATTHCHLSVIKLLLEKGANVEGGACLNEDKVTETPLQLSAASGRIKMVELLLSYNAHPFLSTTLHDSLSYSGAAQRGCYSAIAVAAAHGQRAILHKLLSHPMAKSNKDVLSLEEILAEGASQLTSDKRTTKLQIVPASVEEGQRSTSNCSNLASSDVSQVIKLTKTQLKSLQEAMYHSAENGNLEITLDLRNIGVPWTLHCWMHTLATAHDLQLENIIDQLLQDFLHGWPEDCSSQFVDECLPLLFTIFRHSKKEGTSLLLADIFSTCYGKEPIKTIHDVSFVGGARIDPKYVNNPEMSDVQFRVEGRVFYAHKIILVNASPRFKSMLSSKCSDETPPVVQINDIRYDIFQLVMQYLYKGGCEEFDIDQNDVLELMAAAEFFQLDGLLRFCEAQSSRFVDLDNVVSMYVHAKVYSASHLLEFCQGFLLQNMVALLTYDDSVRKLIFGKKLHNHDVLSGLLLTLQARIKERSQGNKSSIIGK